MRRIINQLRSRNLDCLHIQEIPNFQVFILLIAAIFVCLPLLSKNIDISYDDGIQHIARLMGTYQSIQENQSFPVIMSNFCNGFGYSWNLFYSPFTAYMPLIFKLIGLSFTNCIKIFMFCMVFASGITAYLFAKEVTKNKKIALLTGIFYIFAPYRLTDMYARNALAELASFAFLPMVFHGLYGVLKNKNKKEYILIIGAIGLILTHTVITMYVAILCLIYILTQVKSLKNKNVIKKLIISIVFILIITSFFWVPLLEHKFSAEYEVFKPGRMERTEVLIAFKLHFLDLFRTPRENIMIYEIGWVSIILLLLTPLTIKKLRKKYKATTFYSFYIFALIAGLILVIMTLKIFPFEHLPKILKMLQFSFRLLEFSSFFFAFVASVNFCILIKKVKYRDIAVVMLVLILFTITYTSHLHYTDNLDESRIWPAVPVTSSTGRVHAGCATFEYLPSKAFENRRYIETRAEDIVTLIGNVQIGDKQKKGTNLECEIYNAEAGATIELPYIYYLGYSVTLEQNEEIIQINNFETENGFVGVKLPKLQNATIKVSYTGTTFMKISKTVSILGVIFLIAGILRSSFWANFKNKPN